MNAPNTTPLVFLNTGTIRRSYLFSMLRDAKLDKNFTLLAQNLTLFLKNEKKRELLLYSQTGINFNLTMIPTVPLYEDTNDDVRVHLNVSSGVFTAPSICRTCGLHAVASLPDLI